jgi:excinuclease ABC subunit C
MILEIRQLIKGNIQTVVRTMKQQMMDHAREMEFEKAQHLKEKLQLLELYRSKSTVVSSSIDNVDVFSIVDEAETAWINYLKVVEGAIVQSHSLEMKKKLEESPAELLALAIAELRQRLGSNAPEMVLPFEPDIHLQQTKITIPQRGEKKQLLELSEKNARHFKMEVEKQRSLIDPERHQKRILQQLQKDLRLDKLPEVIECFDNSNFQGDYAVAAMVQFKQARPNKAEYRHFNIKTVDGPNDFASMEEIIHRRYSRLLKEEKALPQLIVIDGGKGQLGAAVKALESMGLRGKIAIIGIAKRLEEIYFPGDSLPIYMDKRSESLKLIQFLRDEAHRFGITHHRKKFEKGFVDSKLNQIKGIGESTAQKLLLHFKSTKNIAAASVQELTTVVGTAKARLLVEYFSQAKK